MREKRIGMRRVAVMVTFLLLAAVCGLWAQQPAATSDPWGDTQSTAQQSVSKTGLLPVYGVDFAFDKSWVDGDSFPSKSMASGVGPTFQQVWDTLKTSGFNVVRFPLDVRSPKEAATRLANLCVWAKANNVSLVPQLVGSDPGQPLAQDFSTSAPAVIKETIKLLKAGDAAQSQCYTQVMAFQLGQEMNHPGVAAGTPAETSVALLKQTASSLRAAEQEALAGTGLSATPIMLSASFDCELIKNRAMGGGTLTDDSFTKSCESLKTYVGKLAGISDSDLISVEWLPGSISAGGAERLSSLIDQLKAAAPNKQIVLTTGYSTAFNSPDAQKQYCAVAFSNLADYRARDGASSLFIGMFYNTALNTADASCAPPASDTQANMASWNWETKADELAGMWSGKPKSDELDWWQKRVGGNLGLAEVKTDSAGQSIVVAKAAQQCLQQIATSVTQANTEMATSTSSSGASSAADPWGTSTSTTSAGTGSSSSGTSIATDIGTAVKTKVKEGLLGLLDKVFAKIGDKIASVGSSSGNGFSSGSSSGSSGDVWGSSPSTTSSGNSGTSGTTSSGSTDPWSTTNTGSSTSSGNSGNSGTTSTSSGTGSTSSGQSSGSSDVWGDSGSSSGSTSTPPSVSVAASDLSVTPASPKAGEDVDLSVTLHNQSSDHPASGLTVAVTDGSGVLVDPAAQATDVTVPAGGAKTVTIKWKPQNPGNQALHADVYAAGGSSSVAGSPFSLNVGSGSGPSFDDTEIEIKKEEAQVTPSSPKANTKATVDVQVRNTGEQDQKIDLVLVDASSGKNDAWLAETNGISVGKQNSGKATIEWTPTQPGTYTLSVMAFKGDELLTRSNIADVTVGSSSVGATLGAVTVDPATPQPKKQFNISVSVQNTGAAEAKDLDVYVYDPSAALSSGSCPYLANTKIAKIDGNGTFSADLKDIKLDAAQDYSLTVEVWPPDLSAPAPYDQKSIKVKVGDGSGSSGSTTTTDSSGSTQSGDSGTSTTTSSDGGASTSTSSDSGTSTSTDSSGSSGTVRPGKGGRIIGGLHRLGTVGPGALQAKSLMVESKLPVGLPQVQTLMYSMNGSVPMAGQKGSITFSLTNPYGTAIRGVGVAMTVDGKQVDTRSVGTLLPKQSRSVVVDNITLDKAGDHGLEIALSGGAGGKLKGTAAAKLTVAPGLSARSPVISRPVSKSMIASAANKTGSTRTTLTRSVIPSSFSLAGRTVAVRPVASGSPGASTLVLLPTNPTSGIVRPTTLRPITGITTPRPTIGAGNITIPNIGRPIITNTGATTTPSTTSVRPIATVTRPIIPGIVTGGATTSTTGTSRPIPVIPNIGVLRPSTTTTTAATTPTVTRPSISIPSIIRPSATVTGTSGASTGTATTTTSTLPTITRPTATVTGTTPVLTTRPSATVLPTTTSTPTTTTTSTTPRVLNSAGGLTAMRPMLAKPDLMLTPGDVQLSPSSPHVGDGLSASINVRNVSTVDVGSAKVAWILRADGRQVGQGEIPVSVKANSAATVHWRGKAPDVRQLVLELTAVCPNETNTGNNSAPVTMNVVK